MKKPVVKAQPARSGTRDTHPLLLRAGSIRPLALGVFSFVPLGLRSLNRISAILRQEMEAIGGQEILMPVVNPADLWRESGRWDAIDAELGRFRTGQSVTWCWQ